MSTNAFAATCERCGRRVEPGEGLVSGGLTGAASARDWRVVHNSCIPEYRPWVKDLEYDL